VGRLQALTRLALQTRKRIGKSGEP
jgi:hypothetical protein